LPATVVFEAVIVSARGAEVVSGGGSAVGVVVGVVFVGGVGVGPAADARPLTLTCGGCYDLATRALNKIGHYGTSRTTADRDCAGADRRCRADHRTIAGPARRRAAVHRHPCPGHPVSRRRALVAGRRRRGPARWTRTPPRAAAHPRMAWAAAQRPGQCLVAVGKARTGCINWLYTSKHPSRSMTGRPSAQSSPTWPGFIPGWQATGTHRRRVLGSMSGKLPS
jgi:hypothetical protein